MIFSSEGIFVFIPFYFWVLIFFTACFLLILAPLKSYVMENIDSLLSKSVREGFLELFGQEPDEKLIQVQKTRRDFEGDRTIVVFPLLKIARKSPAETAELLGAFLVDRLDYIENYNVVQGFLNLIFDNAFWINQLQEMKDVDDYGIRSKQAERTIVVEYSSPNTNKPLHLGHIRNNLLGYAISNILEADGNKVHKVNLVNDRGIHICKSMLAWEKWGDGQTPDSAGEKGDHLVGDYYVRYDQEYKKEVKKLVEEGMDKDQATKQAPVLKEAQEMLRKWEAGDEKVNELWKRMNQWVYDGFDQTYKALGVDFDKIYYESETYLLGKSIVLDALNKGILEQHEDGSVWANLEDEGLDKKLLLRSDGTSVYMTQDIGTAKLRHEDYDADDMIYVVGNEQNYHFQVLSILLNKMGFDWGKHIYHLSYGMVELPEGKMKSREGTVVDADDLIEGMIGTAEEMSKELGKLEGYSEEEKNNIYRIIGLGALKYFILKVDPKKNMTFNPAESIDFNGNTGPFIQYAYARINSVIRKAEKEGYKPAEKIHYDGNLDVAEKELIKILYDFPAMVSESADGFNPGIIANYVYDLVKQYNQFYQETPILKNDNAVLISFRLALSAMVGRVIASAMALLGIEVPERM